MKDTIKLINENNIIEHAQEVIDLFRSIDPTEATCQYPVTYNKAIRQLNEYYESLIAYYEYLKALLSHSRWLSGEHADYIKQSVVGMEELLNDYYDYLSWADIEDLIYIQ